MDIKNRYTRWMGLIVVVSLFLAIKVHAGEPLEQLRVVVHKALQILKDPKLQSENSKNERVHRLMKTVNPFIAYEEIAKRSLGAHWGRQTPSKQQEFVRLFRRFLERVYSSKIQLYDGQNVVLTRETMKKGYARIDSNIVNKKGEELALVFKLRRLDGRWKVYDLVTGDISMIDNYHAQFDRIIVNSSYEELVKKIKDKTGS